MESQTVDAGPATDEVTLPQIVAELRPLFTDLRSGAEFPDSIDGGAVSSIVIDGSIAIIYEGPAGLFRVQEVDGQTIAMLYFLCSETGACLDHEPGRLGRETVCTGLEGVALVLALEAVRTLNANLIRNCS